MFGNRYREFLYRLRDECESRPASSKQAVTQCHTVWCRERDDSNGNICDDQTTVEISSTSVQLVGSAGITRNRTKMTIRQSRLVSPFRAFQPKSAEWLRKGEPMGMNGRRGGKKVISDQAGVGRPWPAVGWVYRLVDMKADNAAAGRGGEATTVKCSLEQLWSTM